MIVTEYCNQKTLRHYIQQKPNKILGEFEAILLLKMILEGNYYNIL